MRYSTIIGMVAIGLPLLGGCSPAEKTAAATEIDTPPNNAARPVSIEIGPADLVPGQTLVTSSSLLLQTPLMHGPVDDAFITTAREHLRLTNGDRNVRYDLLAVQQRDQPTVHRFELVPLEPLADDTWYQLEILSSDDMGPTRGAESIYPFFTGSAPHVLAVEVSDDQAMPHAWVTFSEPVDVSTAPRGLLRFGTVESRCMMRGVECAPSEPWVLSRTMVALTATPREVDYEGARITLMGEMRGTQRSVDEARADLPPEYLPSELEQETRTAEWKRCNDDTATCWAYSSRASR